MKTKFLLFAIALAAASAQAKLNVVATLPDFGAIAEEIGGDKIKVTSIARGTEDQHFVDARPSYVRVLNQADVLIEGGAELEVGWLPPLVNGARNNKILSDAPGHVILSRSIQLLEVPTSPVDRSMGDVHPFGNPHFSMDPANGKIIAARLAETFSQLDAASALFPGQPAKFNGRLDKKLAEWTKLLEPVSRYQSRHVSQVIHLFSGTIWFGVWPERLSQSQVSNRRPAVTSMHSFRDSRPKGGGTGDDDRTFLVHVNTRTLPKPSGGCRAFAGPVGGQRGFAKTCFEPA